MELTTRDNNFIPSDHEMMVYTTMAKQAVNSKMYKGIGDEAGVMMIMLSARELGIPPMQALNGGINIINGKAEISARMMSAMIRKAGHQITIKESTDSICTLIGRRCDTGESQAASYTLADAQKAGLVKPNGGWVKFPKDMCFARALSRLARQLFSDVIGIGYVEGEIRAVEAEIALPEDIAVEVVDASKDEEELAAFFSLFQKEDHSLAMEYLQLIMKHFSWSQSQAVKEVLKDQKNVVEKFTNWKSKKKLTQEAT